jgi:DNA-binding transcriptional MerR regulator
MAETLWTIDQLADAVERAFRAAETPDQPSGRVREVPDKRTIRYYTTLGLLDRPAEMRGRTAYYGRKHLLQLAAIKRFQARGLSLVQIQTQMTGAERPALERWAELPADLELASAPAAESASLDRSAALAAELPAAPAAEFWARPIEPPRYETTDFVKPRKAIHLSLADGVTLVLEGPACEQVEQLSREEQGRLLSEAADFVQGMLRNKEEPSRDAALCQRPPGDESNPLV